MSDETQKECLLGTIARLLEKQNEAVEKMREEQNTRMEKIVVAVETLKKHSDLDHDDSTFPQHDFRTHEPAWRAVFETHTAQAKDQAERWRSGMDSTLIFVALFVSVITTFQIPVSQNLSPNPADLTNVILNNLTSIVHEIAALNGLRVPVNLPSPEPFRPASTDEIVTMFWYPALLLSLISAILSVFGRQWTSHLTKKPEGRSYLNKSWRLDLRLRLAEKLLAPILDWLHPILIFSIALFVVGLLYQLWFISFSAGKPIILILTSSIGSLLILGMTAVTIYTLAHGARHEESPFTTTTSLVIRNWLLPVNFFMRAQSPGSLWPLFCNTIKQMGETHHFDQISSIPLRDLFNQSKHSDMTLAVDTIVSVLGSDASLKAKKTVVCNLCYGHWKISRTTVGTVKCHRELDHALESAEYNTSFDQKSLFHIARMIIFLRFNGKLAFPGTLNRKSIIDVYMKIFILDRDTCLDIYLLGEMKKKAFFGWRLLESENPETFSFTSNEYEGLLPAIIKKDVYEYWKKLVLRHLQDAQVTELLSLIVVNPQMAFAEFRRQTLLLSLVLLECKLPLILPKNFDLSNLIKFVTYDERRFKSSRCGGAEVSRGDMVLSYLSLMDDDTLIRQEHVTDFFKSMDEIDFRRPTVRDGISPVDVLALQNRLALIALPHGDFSDVDRPNVTTRNDTGDSALLEGIPHNLN